MAKSQELQNYLLVVKKQREQFNSSVIMLNEYKIQKVGRGEVKKEWNQGF